MFQLTQNEQRFKITLNGYGKQQNYLLPTQVADSLSHVNLKTRTQKYQ